MLCSTSQVFVTIFIAPERHIVRVSVQIVCLFRLEQPYVARSSFEKTTGKPGSVIVPQNKSRKVTSFVWGKKRS